MTQLLQTAPTRPGGGDPPPPPPGRPSLPWLVLGSAGSVLALMLLTFAAEMTLLGPVRHAHDQRVGYDELRARLAEATAPTGQLDGDGRLLEAGVPVALLVIPDLGLREVVGEGSTSGVLAKGPGHRRDTPLPGQEGTSVVMGRQATYGGPFARLAELAPGAEIAVTTAQGTHLFRVIGTRRAGDPAPAATEAGHGRLTLVTGDGRPYAPSDVLRVDADLVSKAQPSPARPVGPAALAESEQAMQGDPSVVLPMLLWGQLLLVLSIALVWMRSVWGRWQTWVVAVPVLAAVGLAEAHLAAQLLPNLL